MERRGAHTHAFKLRVIRLARSGKLGRALPQEMAHFASRRKGTTPQLSRGYSSSFAQDPSEHTMKSPETNASSPQGQSTIPDGDVLSEPSNVGSLNHLNSSGEAHMVSIANKIPTSRSATATTHLVFSRRDTYTSLKSAQIKKGDAIAVARVAGIQAAKRTADLIPLAHPSLAITGMSVDITPIAPHNDVDEDKMLLAARRLRPKYLRLNGGVSITATVHCEGKTGVEMEAMTAASVAGLTMYDMLKGVDKGMELTNIRVIAKSGGKSGNWKYNHWQDKIVKDNDDTKNNQKKNPRQQWEVKQISRSDKGRTEKQPFEEDENIEDSQPIDNLSDSVDLADSESTRHDYIMVKQHDMDYGRLVPVRTLTPQRDSHDLLDAPPRDVTAATTGQKGADSGDDVVLVKRGPVTANDLARARDVARARSHAERHGHLAQDAVAKTAAGR